MPTETERRRRLARRIVGRLAERTQLAASLLAGSVATGTADEHSDIDLLNYYGQLPKAADFDAAMREVGAVRKAELGTPDEESFAAVYTLDGVEVQTGAQLVSALEERLQWIAAGDVDWINAKVAMGILEGLPLHGADLVTAWKARASYPESLRRREVERNLGWFPVWAIDSHLAARDAELFRRQMLLDGAFRVVAVLSALNRLYFTTFQFKRARAHAARMRIKPDHLAEGLDSVANDSPTVAANELRQLVEETKALVRQEMPDVDVEVAWRP